jgi:zinc-ribbon domain
MKCPKCNSEARDIARFCPRCHATLRFECPSCHHEQRHGGTCDKCGVNFLKYIAAVVSAKKAEADALNERIERRSNLLTNILTVPINGGLPLIRQLFGGSRKKRV